MKAAYPEMKPPARIPEELSIGEMAHIVSIADEDEHVGRVVARLAMETFWVVGTDAVFERGSWTFNAMRVVPLPKGSQVVLTQE